MRDISDWLGGWFYNPIIREFAIYGFFCWGATFLLLAMFKDALFRSSRVAIGRMWYCRKIPDHIHQSSSSSSFGHMLSSDSSVMISSCYNGMKYEVEELKRSRRCAALNILTI